MIILVEGPTEAEALPIYLRRVGLDVIREGIAVIPVFGVGNLAKWFRLFSAYGILTYVVFDNDASDDADERRRDDLFDALRIPSDLRARLLGTDTLAVESLVAAFGTTFEVTLRGLFGEEYETIEHDAANTYGLSRDGSKPLVGRYVAEQIDPDGQSPGWASVSQLADVLRALTPEQDQTDEDDIPF